MMEGHSWSDWLEVGDFDLDNDHHLQMRLISSLIDAIEEGRPWLAHRLAEHLRDSSGVHFASEEERMRRFDDPEAKAHRVEHDTLVTRLIELKELVDAEEDAQAVAAAIDLRSALAAHIGTFDRRLAERERTAEIDTGVAASRA